MAKVAKGKTPASKGVKGTKVTRAFVARLNAFVEARSFYNLYKNQVEEGRAEILAEVGEKPQVLVHNGVEVAIIAQVDKKVFDTKRFMEDHSELWEAYQVVRPEFHIRKATPKK